MLELIGKGLALFFVALVIVCIIAAIVAFPLMLLWNWLMPVIFGLKTITFLQAFGLLILSGLLFRSSSVSPK